MIKKILMGVAAVVVVVGGVATLSAYEAHIINVTAKIENALSVTPDQIAFGTVFPQEHISKDIKIALSESFLAEERVDDVNYVIKEKPKVRPNNENPNGDPYMTIKPTDHQDGITAHEYCLDEGKQLTAEQAADPSSEYYKYCYPILCGQLSRTPDLSPNNDGAAVSSPHDWITEGEVDGHLAKSEQDTEDVWTIDLTVPGFQGMVDQDYTVGEYGNLLPASLEHQTFGCDLWVEVGSISNSDQVGIYKESNDYPDGDPNNLLGPRIGTLNYAVDSGDLTGTVVINTDEGLSWIQDDHKYVLVLNGPRTGSTADGFTNQLIASAACDDDSSSYGPSAVGRNGWDGWWSNRTTDNTGATDTDCNGKDDLDPTISLNRQEGYYNFEFDVTGAELKAGHNFTITGLPSGNYNEVQFLIKDLDTTNWDTVGEYPGAGEANGLTSYFDFSL
jgi:hypothetical protein